MQAHTSINEVIQNAFFPKLQMAFSKKENPLEIAQHLEKHDFTLRKEMLLFQTKLNSKKLNDK